MAEITTIDMDLNERASPVVVKTYSSTPALMNPNEGGATPGEKQLLYIYLVYTANIQVIYRCFKTNVDTDLQRTSSSKHEGSYGRTVLFTAHHSLSNKKTRNAQNVAILTNWVKTATTEIRIHIMLSGMDIVFFCK